MSLGKESLGEDAQTIFTQAITEGCVYYAALINLSEAPTEKAGIIMALLQPGYSGVLEAGKTGSEFALLSALQTADGLYKLQISRNNTTVAATQADYNYGTTYLVVVKYTIVEGATNDEVRLYVNPAINAEPATADALYNGTSGSDVNVARGILGLELCQSQASTKNASVLTIDALRIATTWSELFTQTGGEDPDPELVPAITVDTRSIEFEETFFVGGEAASKTINVKAENLTADIIVTATSQNITIVPATIAKEDAMSNNGVDVIVTFTPNVVENGFPNIVFSTEGAADVKIPVSAYVVNAVPDFATMKAIEKASGYYYGAISGEVAITHTYTASGLQWYYIQDATAGFLINDSYEVLSQMQTGDRLIGLNVYYGDGELYVESVFKKGENAPIEPIELTLSELAANAAEYACRLVRVNNVAFSDKGNFAAGTQYDITQEGTTCRLSLFAESDLIDMALPATADVIGLSRNTTGKLISPRSKNDVLVKTTPTAVETIDALSLWTENGTICINAPAGVAVVVYNLLGTQVATLQTAEGINHIVLPASTYLVRLNGKATKVIVK